MEEVEVNKDIMSSKDLSLVARDSVRDQIDPTFQD